MSAAGFFSAAGVFHSSPCSIQKMFLEPRLRRGGLLLSLRFGDLSLVPGQLGKDVPGRGSGSKAGGGERTFWMVLGGLQGSAARERPARHGVSKAAEGRCQHHRWAGSIPGRGQVGAHELRTVGALSLGRFCTRSSCSHWLSLNTCNRNHFQMQNIAVVC